MLYSQRIFTTAGIWTKEVMYMGNDKKSRTEKEKWLEESGEHYKTTISDGQKTREGRGRSSEESQEIASDKWHEDDEDEDDDEDEEED